MSHFHVYLQTLIKTYIFICTQVVKAFYFILHGKADLKNFFYFALPLSLLFCLTLFLLLFILIAILYLGIIHLKFKFSRLYSFKCGSIFLVLNKEAVINLRTKSYPGPVSLH